MVIDYEELPFSDECVGNIVQEKSFWIVLTGYMVILKPTSLALGLFTTRWRVNNTVSLSLQNAGKWIGYLERVLILTFVLIGRIEMIGFYSQQSLSSDLGIE